MRILAVNWLDLENPQAGGAEVHFFEIFRRLVERGHQITLVCSGFPGGAHATEIDGIEVIRYGGRYSFALKGRPGVRKLLRERNFDLVLEDINKLPLYLTQITRLPFYVIVPHLFGTTAFREVAFPVAATVWASELPIPRVYRRAQFHAISDSTRDDLVYRGVDADAIRVIYPGVDPERFSPDPNESRTREPTFLYVGRIKRYKGLETALSAMKQVVAKFPAARLLIAGTGDDRPRLERIAGDLALGSAVKFLGFVSEEDKLRLLRTSWAALLPSEKEGWGITNIEAAACGTPAIASNSPGLRESVRDGFSGMLVRHGEPGALAQAMTRFCLEPDTVARMGRQAREFSLSFSWDGAARRTEEHLVQTINFQR